MKVDSHLAHTHPLLGNQGLKKDEESTSRREEGIDRKCTHRYTLVGERRLLFQRERFLQLKDRVKYVWT